MKKVIGSKICTTTNTILMNLICSLATFLLGFWIWQSMEEKMAKFAGILCMVLSLFFVFNAVYFLPNLKIGSQFRSVIKK